MPNTRRPGRTWRPPFCASSILYLANGIAICLSCFSLSSLPSPPADLTASSTAGTVSDAKLLLLELYLPCSASTHTLGCHRLSHTDHTTGSRQSGAWGGHLAAILCATSAKCLCRRQTSHTLPSNCSALYKQYKQKKVSRSCCY